MTEARTFRGQRALEVYNEVQLCHEMGWTQAELATTDDEFVWACMNVLSLEGAKADREAEEARRGRGGGGYTGPTPREGAVTHHRQSAPPQRVP